MSDMAYGDQGLECAGLNEHDSHRFIVVNIWFSLFPCLGRLGGVVLLENMCHWGRVLRIQIPIPFPVSSLCLVFVNKM